MTPTDSRPHARTASIPVLLRIEDDTASRRPGERVPERRPHVRLLRTMQARVWPAFAHEHAPDPLLHDLRPLHTDGEEPLRRLRSDPRTVEIPLLTIGPDATPDQIERRLGLGAKACLTEPLDTFADLEAVDRVRVSA